ncbi:hypothetical protein [Rhodanobacter sp. B04]|uniref:hypothetical protein n=1 Tax=Rhodanobacter sp. B04 TaxID=1945860 RepID=UPI0011155F72|nr:hypothetical protein [Rhodanobacter sp. B04]
MIGKVFLAFLLLTTSVAASDVKLTKEQIIELAKQASASYCQNPAHTLDDLHTVRCDFIASFSSGRWTVGAGPDYEDDRGNPVIVEMRALLFYYSPSGKLLQEIGPHGQVMSPSGVDASTKH